MEKPHGGEIGTQIVETGSMSRGRKKYIIANILDIYIIRKLLVTFFVSVGLISLIIIVFDLSEKLDDFISNNAPIKGLIFDYYLNLVPHFVNMYGYLFFFISVVFICSKLASRSETIAVLSSGISFRRYMLPFVVSAVLIGVMNLWLSNILIPKLNVPRLNYERMYYRDPYHNQYHDIHIQVEKNKQIYIQYYNNERVTGYKFTREIFSKRVITQKIHAEQITYDSVSKDWIMKNYNIRNIDGLQESIEQGGEKHIDIGLLPHEFNINQIKTEVLDYSQLNRAIERERMRGSSIVTELQVEKFQRLLNPIAFVILTVIGVSLSSQKKRGGTGLNLAFGITLAFSLILFMKMTKVFATNANLPPALAVALPLLIYGIIAAVLVAKAPK